MGDHSGKVLEDLWFVHCRDIGHTTTGNLLNNIAMLMKATR
jgi:hypothetical protein